MKRTKPILALLASIIAICLVLTACGPKDEPKAEYSLDKSAVTLVVDGTHQLNVTSSLENEFEVEYDTSAPTIATVSATGLIKAVAPGTANITATVEGTVLTCVVTVEHKYAISKTSETLEVGEYVDLTVNATPTKDLTVVWSSSNDGVATVSDGRVTAIAEGTATISAKVDGKTLTCDITVTAAEDQYIYSLNVEAEERLEKNKTLQLELTATPARDDDYEIVWDSDDDTVATVSEDGLVTGVADGTATISATVDGEVVAECEITVFHYAYTFATTLDVDYGDTTKALSVTVAPVKDMAITYEVTQGDSVTVGTDGKITTVGVGASTVTIKDGETVIGACVVTVKVSVTMAETLALHIGDDHVMEVVVAPSTYTPDITFEIEEGDDVISLDPTTHTVTAIANGTATVLATVDEKELRCTVTVANVFVTDSDVTNLTETTGMDKDNPVDITVGAEYWEQYIATAETNHKQYDSVDEDIIDCVKPTTGAYLPDYAAWLAWHGGATSATCNCGKCNKDTQNGGDGGWESGGTKAYKSNVEGEKINIDFTVFAGQSTIKVYTGGYNCKVSAKLKDGETVLDTKNIDNTGVHHSQLVEFTVDVKAKTSLTVELEFVDDNDNYPHSAMSLAAASISGDVYRLNKYATSLLIDETDNLSVIKNDNESATNVTYTSSDSEIASVTQDGLITAVSNGDAVITVVADGRVRKCTVNVSTGYNYSIDSTDVYIGNGKTHQIVLTSDPAGSTEAVTYTVIEGSDVISVSSTGLITAANVGSAKVRVSVKGEEKFVVDVTVGNVSAVASKKMLEGGKTIDLTSPENIYWEHYIWTEVNPKSVEAGNDLIDIITPLEQNGAADYGAKLWFSGSSGNKENALSGDTAHSKYSIARHHSFSVRIPAAGNYEIRVYTGVWKAINTVSLVYGTHTIASSQIEHLTDGNSALVTFAVTAAAETTFTLNLDVDEAHNNDGRSKIAAIAIADMSIAANTNIPVTHTSENDVIDILATSDDLTVLDWALVDNRMDGGNLIGAFGGNMTGDDLRMTLKYNDTDSSRAFKYSDNGADATVTVSNNVKKIAVYATGWNSAYRIVIKNANGDVAYQSTTVVTGDGSVASEIVFDVNVDITDGETANWTVEIQKVAGANCGIAGVVMLGETA